MRAIVLRDGDRSKYVLVEMHPYSSDRPQEVGGLRLDCWTQASSVRSERLVGGPNGVVGLKWLCGVSRGVILCCIVHPSFSRNGGVMFAMTIASTPILRGARNI